MGAPQYEQAGADVAGSGTPGTIPVWSSGTTLGDSGLKDDGTSVFTNTRRIGVNTTSTLSTIQLQVGNASALGNYQGAQFGIMLPTGSGSWLELAENSTNGTSFRISKDSTTGVVFNSNGRALGFATSYGLTVAGSQMVLTTAGNVGIGTASPISPLQVKGNATNTDGILTLTPNSGGRNHQVQSLQASSLFRIYDQSAGASRLEIDINGNVKAATTAAVFDASTAGAGLKLPATPGNADTQTFDAYNEVTLSSGFVTSGITSTGTIVITARITRYARGFGVHMKVAPSGGASLTFAAGWYVTLTGAPQMPEQGALSAYTTDGVGRVAVQIDGNATPSIAGMTTGNYGALGANVAVICSGFVT